MQRYWFYYGADTTKFSCFYYSGYLASATWTRVQIGFIYPKIYTAKRHGLSTQRVPFTTHLGPIGGSDPLRHVYGPLLPLPCIAG